MENVNFANTGAKGADGEVPDFVPLRDGNGGEYRLINFENEKYAPKFGIVEVEPVKVTKRHINEAMWRVTNDKIGDFLIGIPLPGWNPKTKEIEFTPLVVRGKETYDLSIPKERQKWICLKYSPFYSKKINGVEQNHNLNGGSKTIYRAIDVEQEAKDFQISRRVKRKAIDIAEALVGEELEDMALMLGFDPRIMSPDALYMNVVKFVENENEIRGEKGADIFMRLWDSDLRVETSIIKRAMSVGLVTHTPDNGINRDGLTLGYTEAEAAKYLKDHPSQKVSLDTLSRKKQSDGDKAMVKPTVEPINDHKDAEISRLRAQLAAAEKSKADATDRALELQAEKELAENDPEYQELLAEAKRLDIRGAHNIKSKDRLKEKIAEKQKLAKN